MKLITKGVKGVDHEVSLGPRNLITGPNGSGKSTIADSIRFGALGYVPALGKRPVDTAALMHNGSMSVELVLDDGRTVRRSLDRQDRGFIAGAEASWLRNAKPTETAKAILGIFGAEEQDVAECLDIRELLTATPNQRSARIEQLLAAGQRSPEEIARAVARFTVMRLIPNLPEDRMPADYLEALPMVTDRHKAALKEHASILGAKITEAGIQGALAWANEEKRDAATGLKQKEAAAHELRKRAVEIPEPDPRDIERLEGEKARLQRDLGALQERSSAWGRQSAARRQAEAALVQVREMADRTNQVALDAEAVHGKAIAELEEKAAAARKALDIMQTPAASDDSAAEKLRKEAFDLEGKAAEIKLPEKPSTVEAQRKVDILTTRLQAAKQSTWAEVLAVAAELDSLSDSAKKGKLAKCIKRLRDAARLSIGATPEELEHDLEAAGIVLAQIQKEVKEIEKEREELKEKKEALFEKSREKGAQATKLRDELRQADAKARSAYETTRTRLLAERQDLEGKIATHRRSLEAARGEKLSLDRRLASLQDQLAGAGDPGPAPEGMEALEAKLRATAGELGRLVNAQAVHREIQSALSSIEEAQASRDVFTAIEWALQRQREVEISESGGALLGTVRAFLEAAGRQETPFIRAGAGSCSIGWQTPDGKDVQIQALSGGEWSFFAAALTASMILAREAQVRILLVEAGETDDRHLAQLLRGISAIGKGLTAAVVMTPRAPAGELPGWKTIATEYAKA